MVLMLGKCSFKTGDGVRTTFRTYLVRFAATFGCGGAGRVARRCFEYVWENSWVTARRRSGRDAGVVGRRVRGTLVAAEHLVLLIVVLHCVVFIDRVATR